MFEIVKRKVPIPCAIRLAMLVFGLSGVGFGTSSHAQEVPSTVDPGQIERDLRGSREPIRVQPTNPEFGITQEVPDVPEGAENISFVLEQISFTGEKSVYGDNELLGDFKSRIGQEVTVAELSDGEHKIRVYKNYLTRMQRHLNGRGFRVDSVGRFDESTKRAFLEYKKSNNIVGPALPDSLFLVFVLSQGMTQ